MRPSSSYGSFGVSSVVAILTAAFVTAVGLKFAGISGGMLTPGWPEPMTVVIWLVVVVVMLVLSALAVTHVRNIAEPWR